LRWA